MTSTLASLLTAWLIHAVVGWKANQSDLLPLHELQYLQGETTPVVVYEEYFLLSFPDRTGFPIEGLLQSIEADPSFVVA